MILFPAVDIQNGKAVRLKQGKADQATIFADDPVVAACQWQEQGAKWLHIVDLDGAFDGQPLNRQIVGKICESARIPVQLGGGIRSAETARAYLEAGVTRLIIGTVALEDPELFASLCQEFPGRIGVSLDAVSGRLKSRGWVADTGLTVDSVLPRLEAAGTAFIIYTDIERDGMHSGVNLAALEHLATMSSVPVLAAGGVSTLDDLKKLHPLSKRSRLAGAISGRALYDGTLNLAEANKWLDEQEKLV